MSNRLIVYVPGWNRNTKEWQPLIDKLKAEPELAGAEFLKFEHNVGPTSRKSAMELASDLAALIDERWDGENQDILLMGHSMGATIVRKAFLIGWDEGSAWAAKVDRIILMSAMNRGWDPNRVRVAGFSVGWILRAILAFPISPLGRELIRGSEFMTDLRISWIRRFRRLQSDGAQPTVVLIRGTQDPLIHEDDSLDVDQFDGAVQKKVAARHTDVLILPAEGAQQRYEFLRTHILRTKGTVGSPETDSSIKDTILLVHGIRSKAFDWPSRALERVGLLKRPEVKPVTLDYKYFSALHFALPFLRRRQLRTMRDEYSYYFAKYPTAKFHFIGHSFGTYLLGQSLLKVPSMVFERVTLAGSVLDEDFEWRTQLGKQVAELRNHQARSDMPVGFLCSMLRGLGMRDVGVGGFVGFNKLNATDQVRWYNGGHGAALDNETKLDSMIQYTLGASPASFPAVDQKLAPAGWFAFCSRVLGSRVGAWLLLLLLGFLVWKLAVLAAPLLVAKFGLSMLLATISMFALELFVIGFILWCI